MSDKKKLIAAAVMNIIIFLSTTGIMISYFLGNEGEYHILPMQRFWLFTTDSNILCAVTSLIAAISEMRILLGKSEKIPAAPVGRPAVRLPDLLSRQNRHIHITG